MYLYFFFFIEILFKNHINSLAFNILLDIVTVIFKTDNDIDKMQIINVANYWK